MKILVIEDDPVSLKLIASMLEKAEYDVDTVVSTSDAIRLLGNKRVDMIILDIMMPGIDGLQFLQQIKSNRKYSRVPIIICTTANDMESVQACLEKGAADYIIKPIKKNLLLTKIRRAFENVDSTVLIVDDDDLIRNLLAKTIKREGYKVQTAANGEEALAKLETNKIGAIISDIVMPRMDGMDLLVHVKNKYPKLPMLMITGHGGKYNREEVIAAGADGYITKPFKNIEIMQKLAGLM